MNFVIQVLNKKVKMDWKEKVETFLRGVKHESIRGSFHLAHETVLLLQAIIENATWTTAEELMRLIKEEGKRMVKARPSENAVGNMIRRVLKIIREEYLRAASDIAGNDESRPETQQNLLLAEGADALRYSSHLPALKEAIIEALGELITELETSADNISSQALEHIHTDEVIMTAGGSHTVEAFLLSASKKRKFQIMVAEGAPYYHGQELAVTLGKARIETTLIPDSAVFAMMSHVNKVIIGTHTIMADGGLKAFSGSHIMALAARHFSKPLIVLAAMFKLSPKFYISADQDDFNKMGSPRDIVNYSEGDIVSKASFCNPLFDYVPPELVTLYLSNMSVPNVVVFSQSNI